MSSDHKKWLLEKDGINIRLTVDGIPGRWSKSVRPEAEEGDQDYVDDDIVIVRKQPKQPPQSTLTARTPVPAPPTFPRRNISTWIPKNNPEPSNGASMPNTSSRPPRSRTRSPMSDHELDVNPSSSRSGRPQPKVKSNWVAPNREASTKRVPFTLDDQIKAWQFVYQQMKDAITMGLDPILPKGITFWAKYVRTSGSPKTERNWSSHFRKQMCPTLHEMNFRRETILFLFKNIGIEVDDSVHTILEKKCNANIYLRPNGTVASWKFLDEGEEVEDIADNDHENSDDQEVEELEDVPSSYGTTVPLYSDDDEMMIDGLDEFDNPFGVVAEAEQEPLVFPETMTEEQNLRKTRPTDAVEIRYARAQESERNSLTDPQNTSEDHGNDNTSGISISGEADIQRCTTKTAESQHNDAEVNFQKEINKDLRKAPAHSGTPIKTTSIVENVLERDENVPTKATTISFPGLLTDSLETKFVWNPHVVTDEEDDEGDGEAEEDSDEDVSQNEMLSAIQYALNSNGDDAIDLVPEAVEAAFKKDDMSGVEPASEVIEDQFDEFVLNSDIKSVRKSFFLRNSRKLARTLAGGCIDNHLVYETRIQNVKTALESMLCSMEEKQISNQETDE